MLAEQIDFVVGVDTHKHSHTAAIVTPVGGVVTSLTVTANRVGYDALVAFARERAPGRRIWAIEGTGSFGAGLTARLLEQHEWVAEIDRPARPARRNGAKSDELDAVRAAREVLGRTHLAQPRRRGEREVIRVLLTTREGAMQARGRSATSSRCWSMHPRGCAAASTAYRRPNCSPAAPACEPSSGIRSSIASASLLCG